MVRFARSDLFPGCSDLTFACKNFLISVEIFFADCGFIRIIACPLRKIPVYLRLFGIDMDRRLSGVNKVPRSFLARLSLDPAGALAWHDD